MTELRRLSLGTKAVVWSLLQRRKLRVVSPVDLFTCLPFTV